MAIEDFIDLTHPMESNMPLYPGSRPVNFIASAIFEKDGFHEIRIDCSTHTGTHLDCGYHLLEDGRNTLTTPLNNFYGKGLVADCRKISPGATISKTFLQKMETGIRNADFLLLHTGWSKFWGTEAYFRMFPVLNEEAATYLSSFSLKGIGSDTISFDPVGSAMLPVHHILLSTGLILIENLVNLQSLPENGFIFSCFPLKITNGDGSPIRAVGIVSVGKGQEAGHTRQ